MKSLPPDRESAYKYVNTEANTNNTDQKKASKQATEPTKRAEPEAVFKRKILERLANCKSNLSEKLDQAVGRHMFTIMSIFYLMIGVLLICNVANQEFSCQRFSPEQGSCQLISSTLLQSKTLNIPLKDLKRAEVESFPEINSDGKPVTFYACMLFVNDTKIEMSTLRTDNYNVHRSHSDKINHFIQNSTIQSLKIKVHSTLLVYPIAGLLIAFGIFGIKNRIF